MTILHYMTRNRWYSKTYQDLSDAMRVFNGNHHIGKYQEGIIEVFPKKTSMFPEERYFFEHTYERWVRQ